MAVITEDYRRCGYFRDECDYGMGYVNLPCIGAEVHLPFGGVKKSGNGHPSAAGLGRRRDAQDCVHRQLRSQDHDGPGNERRGFRRQEGVVTGSAMKRAPCFFAKGE